MVFISKETSKEISNKSKCQNNGNILLVQDVRKIGSKSRGMDENCTGGQGRARDDDLLARGNRSTDRNRSGGCRTDQQIEQIESAR